MRSDVVYVDLALSIATISKVVEWRIGGTSSTRNICFFIAFLMRKNRKFISSQMNVNEFTFY